MTQFNDDSNVILNLKIGYHGKGLSKKVGWNAHPGRGIGALAESGGPL